jgi:hypothetical protein
MNDILIFIAVVDAGSIVAEDRMMCLARSAVGKSVTRWLHGAGSGVQPANAKTLASPP